MSSSPSIRLFDIDTKMIVTPSSDLMEMCFVSSEILSLVLQGADLKLETRCSVLA